MDNKTCQEFKTRRDNLAQQMAENSVAILCSATLKTRNKDVEYKYRQDSNFLYLTNFDEPESAMLILKNKNNNYKFMLFVRPSNQKEELWQGRRLGINEAKNKIGADRVFSIKTINKKLPSLIKNKNSIYCNLGECGTQDKKLINWINLAKNESSYESFALHQIISLNFYLSKMRLIKSEYEISKMQQAADISIIAHKKAIQNCQVGMFEYQLEAIIINEFKKQGLDSSYPPIVASSNNACILHYTKNNQKMINDSMVMIDAGCECTGYAADISRSYPVNGKFSEAQKDIYNIVLEAQLAGIKKAKPHNLYSNIHKEVVLKITQGLLKLGLLKGELGQLIKNKKYKKFYMHQSGHWLGLDVHDVGDYQINKKSIKLKKGMAFTIEPGIYISNNKNIPQKYHNIGIRIEDSFVITDTGCKNLSQNLVKTIDELESLSKQNQNK
ncbi:MAG: Xaa-Pro aminopeptidase [Gammaproteobacteria bacterium]|nr:MAG: Xaa-Pro aminopeptidase [Gammaproteobacteria bacterium]